MMKRHSLFFTAPGRVDVRDEPLPPPAAGEVLVQTIASAISPGTEMLIYRGQAPTDMPLDDTIDALAGTFTFPFKYGYAVVGRVADLGPGVDPGWQGRLVFAFNPHESHFIARTANLLPLSDAPDLIGGDPETALFLPSMETAVNLLHDGAPLVGEQVVVFGQGIVGLLTTALLARLPLARLITLDHHPLRRDVSLSLGAHASLDPSAPDALTQLRAPLQADHPSAGADLAYELSGAPAALDLAIAATNFSGRIVIGSWYGQKRADLNLGGHFHRSRIRLISSQVSTLAPELTGRWTKARRLRVAWQLLGEVKPARFITHRFPFADAPRAYALIDRHPAECLQVILTY